MRDLQPGQMRGLRARLFRFDRAHIQPDRPGGQAAGDIRILAGPDSGPLVDISDTPVTEIQNPEDIECIQFDVILGQEYTVSEVPVDFDIGIDVLDLQVDGDVVPMLMNYLYLRADILAGQGRLDEQVTLFRSMVQLYPNNAEARGFLGWWLAFNAKREAPRPDLGWRWAAEVLAEQRTSASSKRFSKA